MAKRNGKFYFRNEREVMESLGMRQTKGSGNGWLEKEDGQNDYLLCQLKSTDANSIKVNQLDVHKLVYNAEVAHKVPMFAIQYLNTGEVWLMIRPEDVPDVAKYIETGECEVSLRQELLSVNREETKNKKIAKIESDEDARKAFHNEREKKYKKERKAY